MRFEWDEAKRESNILKHGIDFVGIDLVFEAETVTILDDRFNYGEERFVTLGLLNAVIPGETVSEENKPNGRQSFCALLSFLHATSGKPYPGINRWLAFRYFSMYPRSASP